MLALLLLVVAAFTWADPVDQVANQGADIILKSRIAGQTVRQCSCAEQQECAEEMKAQAKDCSGPCFAAFAPITNRPGDLRKCFDDKDDILQGFLTCFEQKVEGCVPDRNGPQIPKTNILKLFSIGEHRLVNQSAAMQSIIAPIKHIVNAAGDFAKCIKDCFLAKNANGFCFDRKGYCNSTAPRGRTTVQAQDRELISPIGALYKFGGKDENANESDIKPLDDCQPLVLESKAKNSFRHCTRKLNWKREAGEFCDCSVNAGVTDLKQYCAMFRLMGKRTGGRRRA